MTKQKYANLFLMVIFLLSYIGVFGSENASMDSMTLQFYVFVMLNLSFLSLRGD